MYLLPFSAIGKNCCTSFVYDMKGRFIMEYSNAHRLANDIRQSDDLDTGHTAVNTEVGGTHEPQSHNTDFDFFHKLASFFWAKC